MEQCPECGAVYSGAGCPNGCDDVERAKIVKQLFSVSMPWGIRMQVVQQMSMPIITAGTTYWSGGCVRCPYTACVGELCTSHPSHFIPAPTGLDLSAISTDDLKKELEKRGER